MDIACVPMDALFEDGNWAQIRVDVLNHLRDVEIVLGRDISTQEVFVISGHERLAEISNECESGDVDVLMIELDLQSDQLAQVLKLVDLAGHPTLVYTQHGQS